MQSQKEEEEPLTSSVRFWCRALTNHFEPASQLGAGTEKRATCFATLLQNELNSDDMLRLLPPMFKPANNLICCKTGFMSGW